MAAPRGWGAAATLAAICFMAIGLGAWLACYNPHVPSGTVECAVGTPQCPDGFSCIGNLCFRDGAGGAGGGGAGGSSGTGGAGGAAKTRQLGETCAPSQAPDGGQTDDCDPSLVCVQDCASYRCYRPCQTDLDCPESLCTTRGAPVGTRLCEIRFTTCDPVGGKTGCAAAEGCYLLSSAAAPSGVDQLVCDCPAGSNAVAMSCSDSRDCFAGLVCPPQGSGVGAGYCQRLCDPLLGDAPCAPGMCRPFGDRWGFCF
jgi:hypothetical protein